MKSTKTYCLMLGIMFSMSACKKFLDEKPNIKLTIPKSVQDLQLVLDDYSKFNAGGYPVIGEFQSDNYYLTTSDWLALPSESYRSLYSWVKHEFREVSPDYTDYGNCYNRILSINTLLDESTKIEYKEEEKIAFDNAVGSALFLRAYFYQALAQIYVKPYNSNTATTDLGLALRSDPDFSYASKRSSVEETYHFTIRDLEKACTKLPMLPLIKSRPSKASVYGLLARVYLYKNDFANALLYADSCLNIQSELINFNELNTTSAAPFVRFNKEVIFHGRTGTSSQLAPSRAKIDPELYNSYSANDLRKVIYFRSNTGANLGTYSFKGNLDAQTSTSSGFVFGGIVTDEIYLIRAEAKARTNDIAGAMQDLNKLLETRWVTGTYVPFTANTQDEALTIILRERRKELLFRGTRWSDIRRLTGIHQIIPKRVLGDKIYTLEPGSLRYVLTFPLDAIQFSDIVQNP